CTGPGVANWNGKFNLTVTVVDGFEESPENRKNSTQFSVTVNPVNDAPTINFPSLILLQLGATKRIPYQTYRYAYDVDLDTNPDTESVSLTFVETGFKEVAGFNSFGHYCISDASCTISDEGTDIFSLEIIGKELVITSLPGQQESHQFNISLKIEDASGQTAEQEDIKIKTTTAEEMPIVSVTHYPFIITEGDQANITVLAYDPNVEDSLTLELDSIFPLPPSLPQKTEIISEPNPYEANFTWQTPELDRDTKYSINFKATDDSPSQLSGKTATDIYVNDKPQAEMAYTHDKFSAYNFTLIAFENQGDLVSFGGDFLGSCILDFGDGISKNIVECSDPENSIADLASYCQNLDPQVENPCKQTHSYTTSAPLGGYIPTFTVADRFGAKTVITAPAITPDIDPPALVVQVPVEGAYYTTVNINYTATDDVSGVECEYSFDSLGYVPTIGCANLSLLGVSDGAHTVQMRVTDGVGRQTQSPIISFTLDTTTPQVIINLPLDDPVTPLASPVSIDISASDANILRSWFIIDSGAEEDFIGAHQEDRAFGPGPHTIEVHATDLAGHASIATAAFIVS
ncbi:hypothetical protein KY308_03235, partial [Candidatus Woesearchaeota archaeon]|nr:hypothetical protein [Candidatus Woesearchaeota archaeon]